MPSTTADAAELPDRQRTPRRLGAVSRALGSQIDVVIALILRETRTRFGKNQLGYLWALIEPTVVIFTFYFLLRVTHRGAPAGMDVFSFVATGVIPYTLFINSVNRVAEAVNGNKALLYYPQVRPIDLVIARCALEVATFFAVFVMLLGGYALVAQRLDLSSPLLVIAGMLTASALGSALGLVFMGLSQVSPLADRVRGPLLRPLFWVSGIFFTIDSAPEVARSLLLYNPVLHATELVRAGWFESHGVDSLDMVYVLWWIGGLALVGLLLERWVRRKIELT